MAQACIILNEFLQRGLYQDHLRRVNAIYGRRRDPMVAALEKEFKAFPEVGFIKPKRRTISLAQFADWFGQTVIFSILLRQ